MNFSTIKRQDNKIVILAQTRLPQETRYLELDDYRDVIDAIKRLEIRGAPAIGIAAAYGIALAVHQTGRCDTEFLREIGARFKDSRPTAVNLFWAVDRMLNKARQLTSGEMEETITVMWTEAEAIHEEDRKMCEQIGKHGATLINDGDAILTHCNAGALATGGIGTALGVIYTAHDQGKKLRVYAGETRPLLQGARLTVWELMQAGIDVTLICDNTAGMLMRQGAINHVIVGADRIARNGDFANKIGTYPLAVLAEHHGVPFYVAAPGSTFDDQTESGDDIIIEERASHEVTEGFGERTAPVDAKVYSPAFDVTPFELITSFITDEGIRAGGRKDS